VALVKLRVSGIGGWFSFVGQIAPSVVFGQLPTVFF
jgi:hypothetical protein